MNQRARLILTEGQQLVSDERNLDADLRRLVIRLNAFTERLDHLRQERDSDAASTGD